MQPGTLPLIGLQQTITVQDVLNSFSSQFIFRTELMAGSFLLVMCYLEYYTFTMQKEHRAKEKALGESIGRKNKDKILCLISDIFFLASVAYALTFLSYLTGWFT